MSDQTIVLKACSCKLTMQMSFALTFKAVSLYSALTVTARDARSRSECLRTSSFFREQRVCGATYWMTHA